MHPTKLTVPIVFVTFIAISVAKVNAQVQFLEQNWTPEVRQSFYTTTQGSRIMPYAWFMALETSDSQDSFVNTQLPKLGYLANNNPTNNPDRLPVGFVADDKKNTGERYIGLTCAACHTNQIEHSGITYQIDGAPGLIDTWGLLDGLNESLKVTCSSPEKKFRDLRPRSWDPQPMQ